MIFVAIVIILAIIAGSCKVKQTTFISEKTSDSISFSSDTTFKPGVVPVDIEGDQKKDSTILSLKNDLSYVNELYFTLVNETENLLDSLDYYKAHPAEKTNRIETILNGTKMMFNTDVSHLETALAYSDAWVKAGKLFHTLNQKDTTINAHSDSATMVVSSKKESFHSSDKTYSFEKIVKKNSIWFYLIIGAIIVAIAIYLFKKFF